MPKKKNIEFYIDADGCYICTSHFLNKKGYARCTINGEKHLIHRHVYTQMFGSIPDDYMIRHKCDKPACIRPDHLEPGTNAENVQDRVERGRTAVGEKVGNAVLTEAQVVEILQQPSQLNNRTIADLYGVHKTTIRDIRSRRTWKHIQLGGNEK